MKRIKNMNAHLTLRSLAATSFLALAVTSACGLAGCGTDPDATDPNGTEDELSAKPPQYVLLAFDGSYANAFWQESRDFAKSAARAGKPLKFTYFINASYYVPRPGNQAYFPPKHRQGASAIGWGDDDADVAKRIAHTNAAFEEGHEIGSHTVGHWDGSTWSAAEWDSEFDQFDKLLFETNHPGAPAWKFGPEASVGFRAPQLGHSPGLFPTLVEHGYIYDTSKSNVSSYWPQKQNGVWNMPLAELRIVGNTKKALSMDYNFYVAHSKGLPDAANKATYKKQMYDTYMAYFDANYNGNRAPLHIGHHFSKWNGGAYWEAMQEFALAVCGKPNV
ncbi:MAG: hypothetical protein EOP08_15845, partial [Proteobacteria bacterium]